MSPRIYRNRLLKLAALLHSLPRRRFDFGNWGVAKAGVKVGSDLLVNASACGTSACAIGWAPALPFVKKEGWSLRAELSDKYNGERYVPAVVGLLFKNGTEYNESDLGEEMFGLDEEEFSYLFHPNYDRPGLGEKATPKRVARHIREFVKNKYG